MSCAPAPTGRVASTFPVSTSKMASSPRSRLTTQTVPLRRATPSSTCPTAEAEATAPTARVHSREPIDAGHADDGHYQAHRTPSSDTFLLMSICSSLAKLWGP